MNYDNLKIYKSALALCVDTETIVKSFDKYHKYTIGADLRDTAKELLFYIHKINTQKDKTLLLKQMISKCEEHKMLIQLAKELKAFKSFKQFEDISLFAVSVCKQAQGWLKYVEQKASGGGGMIKANFYFARVLNR